MAFCIFLLGIGLKDRQAAAIALNVIIDIHLVINLILERQVRRLDRRWVIFRIDDVHGLTAQHGPDLITMRMKSRHILFS